MNLTKKHLAVVGGGPAGLRAAEVAATRGLRVTLFDAKPSVGRKFLVAGKSGLNLTNSAPPDDFLKVYSGRDFPHDRWRKYFKDFDNYHLAEWASALGVDTFAAPNGKVFPFSKKAAPLLRRWVLKLRRLGIDFQMKHSLKGIRSKEGAIELRFETGAGTFECDFDAVILAMGGAAWPQTGSTGAWVPLLEAMNIEVVPLESANCGWECPWSEATLALAEGKALQNITVTAGGETLTGELVVTRYGFEGTPIYTLGPLLRKMEAPAIEIDFKPTFTEARLIAKMESARRDFYKEAQLRWKLNSTACALIRQLYGEMHSAEALAKVAKCCRIPLSGPRPLTEAISTAGGVAWSELDEGLMLDKLPGVFCAGEMVDWEAPTGGFLMQACFSTGQRAGTAAAEYLERFESQI